MANYTIKFSCGHEGVVSLFGKCSERERKIRWYEEEGVCSECFKQKKMAEEAKKPLTLNHTVNVLKIDEQTGEILFELSFSGNTMPHKDAIKALGYKWEDEYVSDFRTLVKGSGKAWRKEVKQSNLAEEFKKAEDIGAIINTKGLAKDLEPIHLQGALKLQEEWNKRQAAKAAIPKPKVPAILKGHKWNNTIYGKKGGFRVYLDGAETFLTDEEAEEIKKYVADKAGYKEKLAAAEAEL